MSFSRVTWSQNMLSVHLRAELLLHYSVLDDVALIWL